MTRAACKRNIFIVLALFILVQFGFCEDINKKNGIDLYRVTKDGKAYYIKVPLSLTDKEKKELIEKQIKAEQIKADSNPYLGFVANFADGLGFGAASTLKGVGKVATNAVKNLLNPSNPENLNAKQAFYMGRDKAGNLIRSYEEAHSGLAFGAQVLGSLPYLLIPCGVATKGALVAKGGALLSKSGTLTKLRTVANAISKNQLAKTAASGGIWGGLYGAGRGLSETDTVALLSSTVVKNMSRKAITDGLKGAIAAPIFGRIAKGVGRVFSKSARAKKFVEDVGEAKVAEALKRDVPLLDIADRRVLSTAQQARLRNVNARQIIEDYATDRFAKQRENLTDIVDKTFGKANTARKIGEIEATSKKIYEPLYEEANKVGSISTKRQLSESQLKRMSELDNKIRDSEGILEATQFTPLTKNENLHNIAKELSELKVERAVLGNTDILADPRIKTALKEWRKLYPEYDYLPDNNVRVLQGAKQMLNATIEKNADSKSLSRMYMQSKAPLEEVLNTQVPAYAQADKEFSKMKQLIKKAEEGNRLSRMDSTELERISKELTPENRSAFQAGLRENLTNQIDRKDLHDNTNLASKVFNNDILKKLRTFGYDVTDKVKDEINAGRNLSELLGGSDPMQKSFDAKASDIFSPGRLAKKALNFFGAEASRNLNSNKYVPAAEALTNTDSLRKIADMYYKTDMNDRVIDGIRRLAAINYPLSLEDKYR
ncbi:MAG: hypothetical protein LE178_00855 [Endomicrobium sp.]|nr:hypothetical protein [Endomicrobium sp.]